MKEIIFFDENRVRRLYLGGGGIDRMRGRPPQDGYYPEDWIASCIEGNTREFQAAGHGLSKIKGSDIYFRDFLRQHKEDLLGERHLREFGANPGVLVKLLDSAIRLPVQVHPTPEDARKYFNAPNGKTEAWIILSCGSEAYIYLGFNKQLDIDVFRRESLNGVYHESLNMMHKIMVKAGDVIVVYGGIPHAIGPGITMVEVMEPSDLTINPEAYCGDKEISPEKRFGGLSPQAALELFDYTQYELPQIRERSFPEAKELFAGIRQLINRDLVGFFGAQEVLLNGKGIIPMDDSCRIGVVTLGECKLREDIVSEGGSFFLPHGVGDLPIEGRGKIILVQPPEKRMTDFNK